MNQQRVVASQFFDYNVLRRGIVLAVRRVGEVLSAVNNNRGRSPCQPTLSYRLTRSNVE